MWKALSAAARAALAFWQARGARRVCSAGACAQRALSSTRLERACTQRTLAARAHYEERKRWRAVRGLAQQVGIGGEDHGVCLDQGGAQGPQGPRQMPTRQQTLPL